jgi:hypothetical protein
MCSVYTFKAGNEFLNIQCTRFVHERPDSCCKFLYCEFSSFSAFTFLLKAMWYVIINYFSVRNSFKKACGTWCTNMLSPRRSPYSMFKPVLQENNYETGSIFFVVNLCVCDCTFQHLMVFI